jgi:hypothetical protein
LSQKLIIDENARFCAAFRTVVKAPAKTAQIAAVMNRDFRDLNHAFDTIHMLRKGPKIPTTDEMAQSR